MAERHVHHRSALAGHINVGRHGRAESGAGVSIREITDFEALTIIARKAHAENVASVLSRHLGGSVLNAPKRVSSGHLSVSGMAPGQWLAMSRATDAHALDGLRRALTGLAAVTDQGDGRVVLEVAGPRARDALTKGIAIDLDASVFRIGDVAHTSAAHIGVQIALIDATPTFEIVSARSTAASLWSWLTASAAEYGIDVR